MKLGTFHPHPVPPWTNPLDSAQQQFEQMLASEAYGLDQLWLVEHNARRWCMVGNSVVTAAAIAGATKRVRIATAITRLPLHNPTHLAEDLAYVDIISRGRLDWGVGKGYDPQEFGAYGVNFEHREELWQEHFNAVRQMWSSGRTEYQGRFFKSADAELLPTPLQRPEPPIYFMVSGSEATLIFAAQHGLPVAIGSGPGWEDIRQRLEMYADVASKSGFSDERILHNLRNTWQLRQIHVSTSTDRAIFEFERGVMWYFSELGNRVQFGFKSETPDYQYFLDHHAFTVGSPDSVVNEFGEYCERTGINNIICWVNVGGQPHGQVLNAIQMLGEEVLPQLREVRYNFGTRLESRHTARQEAGVS